MKPISAAGGEVGHGLLVCLTSFDMVCYVDVHVAERERQTSFAEVLHRPGHGGNQRHLSFP
jgi:hypothetical protein